jgi:uncharacterized protein YeaO (DUF488 family)
MKRAAKPTSKSKLRRKSAARPKSGLIAIKRIYEEVERGDGLRILIDRLWPRGVAKATLEYDAWLRDLAPSNELRNWYRHDPKRYAEFRRRYRIELAPHREELAALRARLKGRKATLLTATHEVDLSHATVLRDLLTRGGWK